MVDESTDGVDLEEDGVGDKSDEVVDLVVDGSTCGVDEVVLRDIGAEMTSLLRLDKDGVVRKPVVVEVTEVGVGVDGNTDVSTILAGIVAIPLAEGLVCTWTWEDESLWAK